MVFVGGIFLGVNTSILETHLCPSALHCTTELVFILKELVLASGKDSTWNLRLGKEWELGRHSYPSE